MENKRGVVVVWVVAALVALIAIGAVSYFVFDPAENFRPADAEFVLRTYAKDFDYALKEVSFPFVSKASKTLEARIEIYDSEEFLVDSLNKDFKVIEGNQVVKIDLKSDWNRGEDKEIIFNEIGEYVLRISVFDGEDKLNTFESNVFVGQSSEDINGSLDINVTSFDIINLKTSKDGPENCLIDAHDSDLIFPFSLDNNGEVDIAGTIGVDYYLNGVKYTKEYFEDPIFDGYYSVLVGDKLDLTFSKGASVLTIDNYEPKEVYVEVYFNDKISGEEVGRAKSETVYIPACIKG